MKGLGFVKFCTFPIFLFDGKAVAVVRWHICRFLCGM